MADQLKEEIWKLEMMIDWFQDFCDYVQTSDYKLYDYACEFADNQEQGRNDE